MKKKWGVGVGGAGVGGAGDLINIEEDSCKYEIIKFWQLFKEGPPKKTQSLLSLPVRQWERNTMNIREYYNTKKYELEEIQLVWDLFHYGILVVM